MISDFLSFVWHYLSTYVPLPTLNFSSEKHNFPFVPRKTLYDIFKISFLSLVLFHSDCQSKAKCLHIIYQRITKISVNFISSISSFLITFKNVKVLIRQHVPFPYACGRSSVISLLHKCSFMLFFNVLY